MSPTVTQDDFLNLATRSGLVSSDVIRRFLPGSSAAEGRRPTTAEIAQRLVDEGLLTSFQSRELLRGRWRGFFIADKYKLLHLLGKGGMGMVVLCEHLMLQRLVAVKLMGRSLAQEPGTVERFLREARASAAIDHPNVARVFDVDRSSRGPYIVMEYIDGSTLHDLVYIHGALDYQRAAHYIRQAACGLEQAHQAGLVHRDIKPGNLMVDRSGTIKLLDLGLARFFDAAKNNNLTGRLDADGVMGSADFIAPEQALGKRPVDIRADIYSLGCTFYFLLARRLPFPDGSVMEKLLAQQSRQPESIGKLRPEVPAGLVAVLEKMLRKKPADRYQTPAELVAALSEWTAQPAALPSDAEMPLIKPSSFRLGLVGALLRESLQASATPPPSAAEISTRVGRGTRRDRVSRENSVRRGPMWPCTRAKKRARLRRRPFARAAAAGSSPRNRLRALVHKFRRPGLKNPAVAAVALLLISFVAGWVWHGRFNPRPGTAPAVPIAAASTAGTGMSAAANSPAREQTAAARQPVVPSITLHGGGSTFIKPLMERWARLYEQQNGVRVEYAAARIEQRHRRRHQQISRLRRQRRLSQRGAA